MQLMMLMADDDENT